MSDDALVRLCQTVIDVHAEVVMDTPEDRELHDRAVETFRARLAQLTRACATCDAITPTGLRRKEMAGFRCPTCGHQTPYWTPAKVCEPKCHAYGLGCSCSRGRP